MIKGVWAWLTIHSQLKLSIMEQELITLVNDAKQGSVRAFTSLYNKFKSNVWVTIFNVVKNSDVADDLTSIVFTKAHAKLDTYVEHISFNMWLKTIAVNTAIDYIRRSKNEQLNTYVDDEECKVQLEDVCMSPEEDMVNKEQLAVTLKAITTLKKKYRDLIQARMEGLSYKQIADKLAMTELAVRSDLNKARSKLRKKTNY